MRRLCCMIPVTRLLATSIALVQASVIASTVVSAYVVYRAVEDVYHFVIRPVDASV